MVGISGCGILDQIKGVQNFAKCEFRLATVNEIKLADVNIQNIKSFSDLNFMTAAKLKSAITSDKLPLTFTLNIEAKNPNTNPASMNKLEWILFIDDIEMTSGSLAQNISIAGNNSVSNFPLNITLNLKEILSGKSFDSVVNFAFNLSGEGNKPTRFLLKAKPSIQVANTTLSYPGYLDIKTEFTAAEGKVIRDQVIK